MSNTIKIYDLQLASGCTISPFVWRTKYALKHKGFDLDIVPGGFTGILERTGGKSERVPAIEDNGKLLLDSWLIAEYLDETYPDRPMLFEGPAMKSLLQHTSAWLWKTAIGPWFMAFIKQYHDRALPQDHAYIRETREKMMGCTIEQAIEGREDVLPQVPPQLEPLRQMLRDQPWIGGETPNFADFDLLSTFLWTASVADTPVLPEDDPLRDWIDRGFDLYGGLGRHPGLSPLFGLKQREGDPEPFDKSRPGPGMAPVNRGPGTTPMPTSRPTND